MSLRNFKRNYISTVCFNTHQKRNFIVVFQSDIKDFTMVVFVHMCICTDLRIILLLSQLPRKRNLHPIKRNDKRRKMPSPIATLFKNYGVWITFVGGIGLALYPVFSDPYLNPKKWKDL